MKVLSKINKAKKVKYKNTLWIDRNKILGPPTFMFVGLIKNRRQAYQDHLVKLYKEENKEFHRELLLVANKNKRHGETTFRSAINTRWIVEGFLAFFKQVQEALELILCEKKDLDKPI